MGVSPLTNASVSKLPTSVYLWLPGLIANRTGVTHHLADRPTGGVWAGQMQFPDAWAAVNSVLVGETSRLPNTQGDVLPIGQIHSRRGSRGRLGPDHGVPLVQDHAVQLVAAVPLLAGSLFRGGRACELQTRQWAGPGTRSRSSLGRTRGVRPVPLVLA